MIHRNDERFFRVVELTCYVGFAVVVPFALKVISRKANPYFMPVVFVSVATVGLVYLARYFIYARPHLLFDRTRVESSSLSRTTKIALGAGFAMCVPMLALGCLGLVSPPAMVRVITVLSPMQFFLR
jgi:hypothetical protein